MAGCHSPGPAVVPRATHVRRSRKSPAWLLGLLLVAGCSSIAGQPGYVNSAEVVTLREMVGDSSYWPPRCDASPCVLTGNGGVTEVWNRHVDKHLALGHQFVVRGLCASACEIAARRAHAKVLPGARLIKHTPSRTVMS